MFSRLEKGLTQEEITLLKAIYSRIEIQIGNESFSPNIGVAQGSLISPALFNIYVEELYYALEDAGVTMKHIMGYADDLFVLCYSKRNLREVIRIISKWSKENNLSLNANKSGVVEFLPRLGRKAPTLNIGEEFEGLPICACYKYLGLWIDQKLTMELQLDHIKKKADWISVKLWPVAKKVSMEYRKNLWKILIRPLFEQLTLLWEMEESKTQQAKVECLLRGTFKKLTLLKKNVSNEIIGDLMQFELETDVSPT